MIKRQAKQVRDKLLQMNFFFVSDKLIIPIYVLHYMIINNIVHVITCTIILFVINFVNSLEAFVVLDRGREP